MRTSLVGDTFSRKAQLLYGNPPDFAGRDRIGRDAASRGPVSVIGQSGDHVVMSAQIFRDMMGVGDDADFAESVARLEESLAQADAGKTLSLQEARDRLVKKYGA